MQTARTDSGLFGIGIWKVGGILGILWAVSFFIGGFILQGETPSRDDSVEDIRQYFTDDGSMYLAGDYILAIAFIVFFLPYAVILSGLLRTEDETGRALATTTLVGALVTSLLGGVAGFFWGGLAIGIAENPEVDDSTIRALMELDTYAFALLGVPAALFLGSASLAILRSGALWRWLGMFGLVIAVMHLIGAAWPIDGDDEGIIAVPGFIAFALTMIWILASSIGMLRMRDP